MFQNFRWLKPFGYTKFQFLIILAYFKSSFISKHTTLYKAILKYSFFPNTELAIICLFNFYWRLNYRKGKY